TQSGEARTEKILSGQVYFSFIKLVLRISSVVNKKLSNNAPSYFLNDALSRHADGSADVPRATHSFAGQWHLSRAVWAPSGLVFITYLCPVEPMTSTLIKMIFSPGPRGLCKWTPSGAL
ncbi:hypothetical protein AALO_G00252200, partial [Alosa alosa]